MKDHLSKPLSIVLYALMGISVLLTLLFYLGVFSESLLISWTYVLIAIASLAAVVFPVMFLIKNPKQAKGVLIAVGGMVVVFGISYALATDEILHSYEKYSVDGATSRNVGMGLIAMYLLGAGAVGAIIYSTISGMLK